MLSYDPNQHLTQEQLAMVFGEDDIESEQYEDISSYEPESETDVEDESETEIDEEPDTKIDDIFESKSNHEDDEILNIYSDRLRKENVKNKYHYEERDDILYLEDCMGTCADIDDEGK